MLPHLKITAIKDKMVTDFLTPELKGTNSPSNLRIWRWLFHNCFWKMRTRKNHWNLRILKKAQSGKRVVYIPVNHSFENCFLKQFSITYFSSQTQLMFCCCCVHLDIIQMLGNLVQCILKGGRCEWDAFPWILLFSLNNCLCREFSVDLWIHSSERVIPLYIKLSILSISLISIYFHVYLLMNLIIYWLVSSFHLQNLLHECRDFVFYQSHFGL